MQVIVAHLKSNMLIGLLNRISVSHHYVLQNSRILLDIVPVRTESYHGLRFVHLIFSKIQSLAANIQDWIQVIDKACWIKYTTSYLFVTQSPADTLGLHSLYIAIFLCDAISKIATLTIYDYPSQWRFTSYRFRMYCHTTWYFCVIQSLLNALLLSRV